MDSLKPVDADELVARYSSIIKSMTKNIVLNSNVVDSQDLEQAGMVALIAAAESYDASTGYSFGSYIRTCIRNALIAEANKCCGVFTIDPRVRMQVNHILSLRKQGLSDDDIMQKLCINRNRFLVLDNLLKIQVASLDMVVDQDSGTYTIANIRSTLEDFGLTPEQIQFVDLLIANYTADQIQEIMGIDPQGRRKIQRDIEHRIKDSGVEE